MSIVSFSYNYILALIIAVITITVLSLFLSATNDNPSNYLLILTNTGVIQLNLCPENYQLLPDSRFSFIGVWLVMEPRSASLRHVNKPVKAIPKQLFIFRDSVNAQDYSRIANVIKQL